jgi:hypothetical protein
MVKAFVKQEEQKSMTGQNEFFFYLRTITLSKKNKQQQHLTE